MQQRPSGNPLTISDLLITDRHCSVAAKWLISRDFSIPPAANGEQEV